MKMLCALPFVFVALTCAVGHAQPALRWQPLREPGSGGWMTSLQISPHDSKRVLLGGDMLGVGLSVDGGHSWQATTGFKSWEIGDLTWHPTNPQIVWAATMSGPYCSRDGGQTWVEKRAGFPKPAGLGYSAPTEKVLFDPNDETHLLAIGGSSRRWNSPGGKALWGVLWESLDGGESWTKKTTLTQDGSSLEPDAKGRNILGASFASGSSKLLYAAVEGSGVMASEDGGQTWTPRNTGLPHLNIERIIAHPTQPNTLFVALGNAKPKDAAAFVPGGIFKSVDAGQHWTSISNGLSQAVGKDFNLTARYKAFAVAPSNPDIMYCADSAWNTGVIYSTRDGGQNWQALATKQNVGQSAANLALKGAVKVETAYPSGLGQTTLSIDPRDPSVAWSLGSEHLVATRDGGKTWQDEGNERTPDGWRGRGFSGLVSWNFRFNPFKKGEAILQAMDAARVWMSRDNMQTWNRYLDEPGPWNGGHDATFTPDGHIYTTSGQHSFFGIGRSVDSGKTWQVLAGEKHGLPDFSQGGTPDGIYARPDAPNLVWACIDGKLYGSKDGGDAWQKIFPTSSRLQWIAADPRNPQRFYVSGSRNVYQTDDGETFTPIGGPHKDGRTTVDSMGRVYVAAPQGKRAGLWRYDATLPAGQQWTRLSDENWIEGVAVDPTNPNRVAYTTNMNPYKDVSEASGVYLSSDAGQTWTRANDGLAMLRAHCIAFDPFDTARLVVGSDGRGFWTARWPQEMKLTGSKTYQSNADDAKFAGVMAAPVAATIALKNGGMEAGTDAPADWKIIWTGKGKLQITRDTNTFKGGAASLHVQSAGGLAQGQAGQNLDATGGTSFTLSGFVKAAGNAKVSVAIQPSSGSYAPISFLQAGFVQNNADWTPFSKMITLPANTAHANIVLLLEGEGEAWLDDVKIEDVKLPQLLS